MRHLIYCILLSIPYLSAAAYSPDILLRRSPIAAEGISIDKTAETLSNPDEPSIPSESWTFIGMGQYTDDLLPAIFSVNRLTYPVEVEENDAVPGLYRVLAPYGAAYPDNPGSYDPDEKSYMIIHAEDPLRVFIEEYKTGCAWKYGEISISSMAWRYLNAGNSLEAIANAGWCGTCIDDIIEFPMKSLLISMANYQNGGWYYANTKGEFRLVLPTARDYSHSLKTTSCTSSQTIEYSTVTGEHITGIYRALSKGYQKIDEVSVRNLYENHRETMQPLPSLSNNSETIDQPGVYTLSLAYVNDAGEFVGSDGCYWFVNDDEDEDQWESLGTAYFTDDIISSIFANCDVSTYKVEIFEKKDTPGLFRIPNPYDRRFYWNSHNTHPGDHQHYLYIDATDPEKVTIPLSAMGVQIGMTGDLIIASQSFIDEAPAPNSYGTYREGIVQFPRGSLYVMMQGDNEWWQVNTTSHPADYRKGMFAVNIISISSVESVFADGDENAPVEYFNLQGIRIDNPSGLVIRRQGSQCSKVFFKSL